MSVTKFGIVVTAGNAIIQRYVYPSFNNSELNNPSFVGPGEVMIQINNGPFPNSAAWLSAINNAVQTTLGKPPGNPRCCVISSNGNVTGVIQADAALCASMFPASTLINSTIGDVGWTWTAQSSFVAPPVSTAAGPHG